MDIPARLRAVSSAWGTSGTKAPPLFNEAADEIERLRRELAQIVSQFSDNVELQEAEQRGFERGRAYERIESDGKEIERLRAALKPFADYAVRIDGHYSSQGYPDGCPVVLMPEIDGTKEIVHLGDLRRARDALEQNAAEKKA